MHCSWEGNGRFGIVLAVQHSFCGIFNYGSKACERKMSTPRVHCCYAHMGTAPPSVVFLVFQLFGLLHSSVITYGNGGYLISKYNFNFYLYTMSQKNRTRLLCLITL